MTVRELKDLLDDYDDGLEVRLAHQPSYPLESTIAGVASRRECAAEAACENDDCDGTLDEHGRCLRCGEQHEVESGPDVVYIAEGRQLGYADAKVWAALDNG